MSRKESELCGGWDNLYVKYSYHSGADWAQLHGSSGGVSQLVQGASVIGTKVQTLNMPLRATFQSSNVFAWPQIVLTVCRINAFGHSVAIGYAAQRLPAQPGSHSHVVQLYAPRSASLCQRLMAWLRGSPPEFYSSSIVATSTGRELLRVHSCGYISLRLHIATRNMARCGYAVQDAPLPQQAIVPHRVALKRQREAAGRQTKPQQATKAKAADSKRAQQRSSTRGDDFHVETSAPTFRKHHVQRVSVLSDKIRPVSSVNLISSDADSESHFLSESDEAVSTQHSFSEKAKEDSDGQRHITPPAADEHRTSIFELLDRRPRTLPKLHHR
ncbi:MAG: hypothetical protein MHM6MM_003962 [Cercozoa sp. M6MM]